MSAARLILLLVLLALASGCTSDNGDLHKANETIALLQSEIQKLQLQNAELERHEEMEIGEIAFSQGCRLLVNTCLGLDEIGAELVRQGRSAHGSTQFVVWAAFKVVFLPILLLVLLGLSKTMLDTLVKPSTQKLREARQIIEDAKTIKDQIAREKRKSLAAVREEKDALVKESFEVRQRLDALNSDIKDQKSEIETLKEQKRELQDKIENLETTKKAVEAFLNRKR
jgi:cell division protein FtsL